MDRVTYPGPAYGGAPPAHAFYPPAPPAGPASSSKQRENEITELLEKVPDIVQVDGSGSLWQLPVDLPPIAPTNRASVVHLQMTVPPDYPEKAPGLKVLEYDTMPGHFWVNEQTGVMNIGVLDNWSNKGAREPLTSIIYQAYTALSSKRYAPIGQLPTLVGPDVAGLRAKLEAIENKQLLKVVTDDAAFGELLQEVIGASSAAKQFDAIKLDLVKKASENMSLVQEYQGILQQITITSQAELPEASRRYEDLLSRQTQVASAVDLQAIMQQLRERLAHAKDAAADLEARLRSMDADASAQVVEAAVSELVQARRRYWALHAKVESAKDTFWS